MPVRMFKHPAGFLSQGLVVLGWPGSDVSGDEQLGVVAAVAGGAAASMAGAVGGAHGIGPGDVAEEVQDVVPEPLRFLVREVSQRGLHGGR